ncbi:hypothetical protein DFH07DRAFT_191959 [Mycena maculata]|uniref:Uncharacterized protein n=1 Tax=Mycena maculata TaxID=230809 RepID=A0AAD7KFD6_9AGAR|nr:hypothetical protein DFH07DRAFT_191959 [Mycena maculata]
MLEVLAHRSFLLLRLFFAFFALFAHLVAGQTLINGQTLTNGLSIIDSPAPSNPGHAGSTIPIAVDVSGDGQLQSAASIPGSGLATRLDTLEIYLVSAQANLNMTVSAGPDLLTGESGSTVKHLNWPIPTCVPAGNYNLTFYEGSHYNGQGVFAITPILIPISNPSPSGQCSNGTNPLQTQPQDSNPLPQSPFAPGSGSSLPGTTFPSTTLSATVSSSGMVTVITSSQTAGLETLTLTLSSGVLELPTVTVTAQVTPTPTTVVIISMATVTETDRGTITTYTQTSTFTAVVTPSPSGESENDSGFIPVNAASHLIGPTSFCLFFGAWTLSVLLY